MCHYLPALLAIGTAHPQSSSSPFRGFTFPSGPGSLSLPCSVGQCHICLDSGLLFDFRISAGIRRRDGHRCSVASHTRTRRIGGWTVLASLRGPLRRCQRSGVGRPMTSKHEMVSLGTSVHPQLIGLRTGGSRGMLVLGLSMKSMAWQ